MSKGYFTFAQNSVAYFDDKIYVDYLKHAYGLALSIHATQSEVTKLSVAVTPNQKVPDKYREVFDQVIEIPWGDMSSNFDNKFFNEWKVGHITPYDETVKIEADMLLTESIDSWWDHFDMADLLFTHRVNNYRGEEIVSRQARGTFDSNNLPNVYNGFMYFKKDNANTLEFFKMAEMISKDYDRFAGEFLDHTRPSAMDTDTVYALATKLIQKETEFLRSDIVVPTFVHMKKELMNWELHYESYAWARCVPYYFDNDMRLYVSNYKQTLPFHYHEKNFLTDNMLSLYEKHLGI